MAAKPRRAATKPDPEFLKQRADALLKEVVTSPNSLRLRAKRVSSFPEKKAKDPFVKDMIKALSEKLKER